MTRDESSEGPSRDDCDKERSAVVAAILAAYADWEAGEVGEPALESLLESCERRGIKLEPHGESDVDSSGDI
jgi:hypothetical protein